jgi:2-keto-4-pentenoate hydratase/2-oxohepta-3-ene-1,7-dioic acid hydratase in catechol pathway
MKLCTFVAADGAPRLGAVTDAGVFDLAEISDGALPASLLGLIEAGPEALRRAIAAVRDASPRRALPLGPLRLLAPLPRPPKGVIGIGLNYAEHVEESARTMDTAREVAPHPVVFIKPPTAVIGPGADIPHNEAVTRQLDWEGELGVVIGRATRRATEADAMGAVFGYTIVNDISARDCRHGGQWTFAKGQDGFAPTGPWVVTADEIPDPHALRLGLRVNGVEKQNGTTAQMIFRIPRLIAHLSSGMTLEPGDIIATGSPSGVGISRTPPEFLWPGDEVEAWVERIGSLHNRVVAAA